MTDNGEKGSDDSVEPRNIVDEDEATPGTADGGIPDRSVVARSWTRGWSIAAVAMVLLVVAGVVIGVVFFSGDSGMYQVGLEVQVRDAASTTGLSNGQPCSGKGVFSFINDSTLVDVRGPTNAVLAVQPLGPGIVFSETHCDFDILFALPNEASYSFQVGTTRSVTFSAQQLKKQHWAAVIVFNGT